MIYFDNSSTTKPSEAVVNAVKCSLENDFANASSLHIAGVRAHKCIESAKKSISSVLGCTTAEIYLTPGGTYSNNLAILSAVNSLKRRGNRIVISSVEHPSVSECVKKLEQEGYEVVLCNPLNNEMFEAITEKTILVSCMLVNNETGLILPVDKLRKAISLKNSPALLHIDAVQAFGKIPINVKRLGADFVTVSAHKINGPKGIGAIYAKSGTRIFPIVSGGEQENGLIPGTYNTPAAAGFDIAVRELSNIDSDHFTRLYNHFINRAEEYDFIKINKFGNHAHHIINLTFEGYLGENVLHFLESYDIFVSQGSACSSHSKQKSKTLIALGKDKKTADCSIRVSFDKNNTIDEIDEFFSVCANIPDKIIKLYK